MSSSACLKTLLVIAGTMSLSSARAADAPIVMAGGQLDPRFSTAEVYVGVPQSAVPPAGRACGLAKRYVDLNNAGKFDQVVDLFEDDAVVLEPYGVSLGRNGIERFYNGTIRNFRPTLVAVAYVGGDTDCMVELSVEQEVEGKKVFRLISVDHFTMGKGQKLIRMVAFARPTRTK